MEQMIESGALQVTLNVPCAQTIERVTAALKEQGFGILTQIDVQATLKQKLDVDFRRYVILGACNPALAHRALSATLNVGLLLPCNVVVYEDDDHRCVVTAQDPITMMNVMDNPELQPIARDAHDRLVHMMDALKANA